MGPARGSFRTSCTGTAQSIKTLDLSPPAGRIVASPQHAVLRNEADLARTARVRSAGLAFDVIATGPTFASITRENPKDAPRIK